METDLSGRNRVILNEVKDLLLVPSFKADASLALSMT
jgi:hypothetical protein